jgi:hypothetical protein
MVEAEGLDRAQQSQNPLSATLIAGERRLASLVQQRPKHNSIGCLVLLAGYDKFK